MGEISEIIKIFEPFSARTEHLRIRDKIILLSLNKTTKRKGKTAEYGLWKSAQGSCDWALFYCDYIRYPFWFLGFLLIAGIFLSPEESKIDLANSIVGWDNPETIGAIFSLPSFYSLSVGVYLLIVLGLIIISVILDWRSKEAFDNAAEFDISYQENWEIVQKNQQLNAKN